MKRRAFLFVAGASAFAGQAQVVDMQDAINKAGRQRMLSQRMSKAYLAQLAGIQREAAHAVMDKSVALFDVQLGELRAYAAKLNAAETYSQVNNTWGEIRAIVTAPASKSRVPQLLSLDGKMLALANQGTQQLEAAFGKPTGRLVNIAGRQRMLSQRMAKLYLAEAQGMAPSNATTELNQAKTEFMQAMQTLKKAPETTSKIQDELQLADMQWLFFDKALQTLQAGNLAPRSASDVFVSSENLLTVMDAVTNLYANLKA